MFECYRHGLIRFRASCGFLFRLIYSQLCLLFYSSAGTSSRRALKAEMRARTNDEIM